MALILGLGRQKQADLGKLQTSQGHKVRPCSKVGKKKGLYKYELFSNHCYHPSTLGIRPDRKARERKHCLTSEAVALVFCCLPFSTNSVITRCSLNFCPDFYTTGCVSRAVPRPTRLLPRPCPHHPQTAEPPVLNALLGCSKD